MILICVPIGLAAQDQGTQQRAKDPYLALADSAMGIPPELGSDILIRLAESSQVTDKTTKIEWLQHAFDMAKAAQFKLRRGVSETPTPEHRFADRMTPGYLFPDPDAGSMMDALAEGFDTLSLQSRAIGAMMPLDREKALDLFRAVPPLQVPALSCRDAVGYGVWPYFAMLQTVFDHGFTPKDRQAHKDVDFLEDVILHVSSPFELAPVSDLLLRTRLDAASRLRLLNAYTRALNGIHADDRSFTITMNAALFSGVGRTAFIANDPASSAGLFATLRFYLVRHLTGTRCEDCFRKNSSPTL